MSSQGFYGSDTSGIFGRLVLEYVGTFLLVIVGTKAAVDAAASLSIAGSPVGSVGVALAFGVTLGILVYALGVRTGCHLNPAVTLAAMVDRSIGILQGVLYIIVQVIGGISASLMLSTLVSPSVRNETRLGLTTLAAGYNPFHLIVVEAVATGILVLVVLFVAVSGRVHEAAAGIAVGGALFVGIMFAGSITGGGMNPARTLGPMIVENEYANVWWYLLAQILGAVVAVLLFKVVGRVKQPDDS